MLQDWQWRTEIDRGGSSRAARRRRSVRRCHTQAPLNGLNKRLDLSGELGRQISLVEHNRREAWRPARWRSSIAEMLMVSFADARRKVNGASRFAGSYRAPRHLISEHSRKSRAAQEVASASTRRRAGVAPACVLGVDASRRRRASGGSCGTQGRRCQASHADFCGVISAINDDVPLTAQALTEVIVTGPLPGTPRPSPPMLVHRSGGRPDQ